MALSLSECTVTIEIPRWRIAVLRCSVAVTIVATRITNWALRFVVRGVKVA
jgi:hypothetical protein